MGVTEHGSRVASTFRAWDHQACSCIPKSTTPPSPLPKLVRVDALDPVGTRDGDDEVGIDRVLGEFGAVDENAVKRSVAVRSVRAILARLRFRALSADES
jgi:hypothetical protein